MQFPPTSFNSDSAMKQLYRQYSTTFKQVQTQKNHTMTQSSNLPFNNFYNAFNSTGNIKNFTLDRFKHSQAKSIIQKLMQTREFPSKNQLDEVQFMNDIQGIEVGHEVGPIPLGKTEQKIFNEVVNLISQIQEIKQKTQAQNQEFMKIKIQLKQQGIQFPQPEVPRPSSPSKTFKRYTSQQLQKILESNDQMQAQIEAITKQLTNLNPNSQNLIESYSQKNTLLKKELSTLKLQIMNAGDIDQQDLIEMNGRIEELHGQIYRLEQKRMGRLTDADDELKLLKQENQRLRIRTIELLKKPNNNNMYEQQRRLQAIRILKNEEQEKIRHLEMMNLLKDRYDALMTENSRLKADTMSYNSNQYEGNYQVESKVSSFHNNFGDYRSSYGKQNFFQNYDHDKLKRNPYPVYEDSVFKSRKSGAYYYN